MKRFKLIPVVLTVMLTVGAFTLFSCSSEKPDSVDVKGNTVMTGSDVITTGTTPGTWTFDKVHAGFVWSTLYNGSMAPLTGKFNTYDMKFNFDQANLSQSWFKIGLLVSTMNTGEPGRDAYGKCGPNYLGVKWDTITKSPLVLKPKRKPTDTDTAYWVSTSIVPNGTYTASDGQKCKAYLAHGNLTFNQVTAPVDVNFYYTGITTYAATNIRCGLVGNMMMSAKKIFKVNDNNISDTVNVMLSGQMKKNL